MMLLEDGRVILRLLRGQPRSGSHADRLEGFYAPQAAHYDRFREKLLHGRRELVERLAPGPGQTVVELGGGTGRTAEFFGPRLATLGRLELVDLCPSLLAQARARCASWPGTVRVVQADATTYRPEWGSKLGVDCVYFSYSLTMIPDWRRALNNAIRMLRPGGLLGVVDFHVPAGSAPGGRGLQGWLARQFWPAWFGHDGVRLSPDHLPEMLRRTDPVHCESRTAPVPYLPGLEAPYYLYVGRKRPG
jgi:S-adenosylmethionine-diacylgycerolhomoserine-N-methlytransferase